MSPDDVVIREKGPLTWIFNPFHYVAGMQALGLGLVAAFGAALIGAAGKLHFDGVLDAHIGRSAPWWFYVGEVAVDWVIISIVLVVAGRILSRTRFRLVDVFGTQALARFPLIIPAVGSLLGGIRRYDAFLAHKFQGVVEQSAGSDAIQFYVYALVALLTVAWMAILMYRGFSVSCNVSGGKAIGVFVAALVVGEILSKILIISFVR